ncbi:M23 family metallopeptidase [Ruminococcus sp. HUN007]|uniref:murein hydrolase activator EnvC family protein n=1 Tax=Ruminococcus sp. HUN007 TaxID=1514668 RepID=UPI0005D24BD4|nr:M23 family metallopeptidase [Ruminococcus sp. HUN007]
MKLRKRIGVLVTAFLLVMQIGTGFVSSEDDGKDLLENKSLNELDTLKVKNNVRLDTLQRGIEQARKQYEAASKSESAKKEYIKKLDEKMALRNENLECTVRQINMLETEAYNTSEMMTDIESEMSGFREDTEEALKLFKQRLRVSYMSKPDNLSSVLMGSSSVSEIISRAELVSRIAEKDRKTLDALEKKLEELSVLDDQLKFKKQIVDENLASVSERKAELDEELAEMKEDYENIRSELEKITEEKNRYKNEYDAQKAAVAEKQKEQEKITKAIKAEQARLKEEMEKLEEEARKQKTIPGGVKKKNTGPSQINVSSSSANMLWPVPGYTSHSSFYGYREFDQSDHKAIDIQGNPNDTIEFAKIYAAENGTVVTACNYCTHSYGKNYSCGCGGGYGNYIVLQHDDGVYQTVYAHCYTIYVSEGEHVRKGQLIGLVGSTGYSTGPHLHFEVRKNGEKTNPDSYTYINYG